MQFIIGHFNDVELMAVQIFDVIRLTLAGTIGSNNSCDNDGDCIDDDAIQQIIKIIEYDTK